MIDETRKMSRSATKGTRSALRAALAAAALAASAFTATSAAAAPAVLANDSDVSAFASLIREYASATRVHWIVAAKTRAAADVLIAAITLHLPLDDRELMSRVKAETFADEPDIAPDASIPIAWMTPQIGQAQGGSACSWQVWVTDPKFPALATNVVNVPMAPRDRLPVSPQATFRVGYTGLVQSKIYAFGETTPGNIRDLSKSKEVNIPVDPGQHPETIFLAMARSDAPFYDDIKSRLAESTGQRRNLGEPYTVAALTRGIGGGMQAINRNQVVTSKEPSTQLNPGAQVAAAQPKEDLTEKCLFTLTPAQSD
jgi:hypothetical protein